ncbi:MAG: hypothetical protein AB7O62_09820 [Pirellulales bacterium]
MPFQFLCPQGHLLEGIESQMGQQCNCPVCGSAFIVPVIEAPPAAAIAPSPTHSPPAHQPPPPAAAPEVVIDVRPPEVTEAPPAEPEPAPPAEEPPKEDPNRIVRIPCPKGHELHTPMSMIGQDAMCPECGEQFNLRYENSVEGIEERELARQAREEKINKIILRSAIGAAIVVGLAIVTMIILKIVS